MKKRMEKIVQYVPTVGIVSGLWDAHRMDKMSIVNCPIRTSTVCNVLKVNHWNLSCFGDLDVMPDTGINAKICPKNSTSQKCKCVLCKRHGLIHGKNGKRKTKLPGINAMCDVVSRFFLFTIVSLGYGTLFDTNWFRNESRTNKFSHYKWNGLTLVGQAHCNRLQNRWPKYWRLLVPKQKKNDFSLFF